MLEFETDSDSSSQYLQTPGEPTKSAVSVLKHLVEARKIMEGQNYDHQITKCVYQQPLASNPGFVAPRIANTQTAPLTNNKLTSLEDALYEHEQLRERIKNVLQNDSSSAPQTRDTLWSLYSSIVPSYSRFAASPRKSNFANVLLPINGVNIQLGSKWADKPVARSGKDTTLSPDSLRFDSHFQSGNLAFAYRSQCIEVETYDLILQNDTNTKGHNQWFYFKVYNNKKHNRIRFNIINFIKDESMFSFGIKPLVFSQRDYSKHRVGWVRDGEKIAYFENKIKRECSPKNYHTLTFEYCFKEVDAIYFAPTHPYTYSQLTQYLQGLMPQLLLSSFFSLKPAVETVGGNSINVLTFSTGRKQAQECHIAWVIARQHPGQTTSSYIIEGIINYLISLFSAPPPELHDIIDNLMFKVVPMLNVDGVVHGNTRAELTGVDPNRIWKKTIKRLSPGVSIIKKLIQETKQNVKLFLDLHSHSKKVGCFFYGNSLLHDPKRTRVYPTLVCNGDQKFQLKHCRFRGGYDTTARSVLFHDLGIEQVFTVECSLLGYMKKNRIVDYKIPDYYQIGKKLMMCHIQLEKTRMKKAEKQIIADLSHLIVDKQDADSARSESSLSDEQYEEIRVRNKNKQKKRKIKRNENQNPKPEQNETIDQLKYFVRKNIRANTKIETSANERKNPTHSREMSANQLRSKFNILNIKNSNKQTQESSKKAGTIGLKELVSIPKLNPARKLIQRDSGEERKSIFNYSKGKVIRKLSNKIIPDQLDGCRLPTKQAGTQVSLQDDRCIEEKKCSKVKPEQLCVVGSSLQDELISVSKNEIGIQTSQQIIEQAITAAENCKKSSKLKKAPKILNYLCSNLIGPSQQNSIFQQDRRLAPVVYKKNLPVTKL